MQYLTTYCFTCGIEIDIEIPDCDDCNNSDHGCEGCELDRHEALEEALCLRCYNRDHPSMSNWERNL